MSIPTGFGATNHEGGTFFRVWAPHAERVAVVGTFNEWSADRDPLAPEGDGRWAGFVADAKAGDEYYFQLATPSGDLKRIDPYARQVTNSVGNGVIFDPAFDWGDDHPVLPKWNEMVVYELHIGTFRDPRPEDVRPATFHDAAGRLGYLRALGVNALEVMPVAEFPGDRSWGYNPSHPFAVEEAYGGPIGFKEFVREAHRHGLAIILDVVYNHFGPTDLDLWRFDGWHEGDGGGIYFYNDHRGKTPWGHTRPDYGRGEVRQYVLDNVRMWFDEYHIDGLRFDATSFIRLLEGTHGEELPDGWSLLQAVNEWVGQHYPGRLTIAEDLQGNEWVTKAVGAGGAGFGAQWDGHFVHPLRQAVVTPEDDHRDMGAIATALQVHYNGDAFQRVVYSESHDEVANGKARIPTEITAEDPASWWAQKRSTLAAALVLTAPGIPMIFQGQEFLARDWFRDDVAIDWQHRVDHAGIVRLYRDLIRLRRNLDGATPGLSGQIIHVFHCNDEANMLAYLRRREDGGDVVVVANFHGQPRADYRIGFPMPGPWRLLFNGDAKVYGEAFTGVGAGDLVASEEGYDGLPASAKITIGPYTALIYAR